jgi:hypothetical protein
VFRQSDPSVILCNSSGRPPGDRVASGEPAAEGRSTRVKLFGHVDSAFFLVKIVITWDLKINSSVDPMNRFLKGGSVVPIFFTYRDISCLLVVFYILLWEYVTYVEVFDDSVVRHFKSSGSIFILYFRILHFDSRVSTLTPHISSLYSHF